MDLAGVRLLAIGHSQDSDLHRRKPQRKVASAVLDQDPDEPLDRAQNSAVNHHRPGFAPLGGRVRQVKPLWQQKIKLDGSELPGPA